MIAARKLVEVNPAYTSADCSRCGHRVEKTLKERWHVCPVCSLSLDRDTNAALNILQTALVLAERETAMGLHSVNGLIVNGLIVNGLTVVEATLLQQVE